MTQLTQLPLLRSNKSFTDSEIQAKKIITETVLDVMLPKAIDPYKNIQEKQKSIIKLFGKQNLYTTSFVKLCNKNYGQSIDSQKIQMNEQSRLNLLKEKFQADENRRKQKIYDMII